MNDLEKLPKLKLVVIIMDWEKLDDLSETLSGRQLMPFKFVCVGEGTANSEIADILGLGSSQKGVVISLQPEAKVQPIMALLSEKFKLHKHGKGIAFSVPLSGVVQPLAKLFKNNNMEDVRQMDNTISTVQHDLIVAVVDQGYSSELMDKAREAGARGGTVINARHINMEETVKMFGISVHAEKEIVIILTKRESKADIMKAINHDFGLSTGAKGMVFSMHAEDVTGINMTDLVI